VKQFDERDTMFSRLGLIEGTKKYREYYKVHPDLQEEDDRVRESTHKTMARIFSIEPDQFKKKSERMGMLLNVINVFLDITGKKIPMNPARMLKMGAAGKEEDIVRSAMAGPAARMANLINIAADKKEVSRHKVKIDPQELSSLIKTLALDYGGDIAGITRLKKHHHYSHRGDTFGMGGGYGKPIHSSYKYAIVIACALNKDMVNRAPGKETQIAAMLSYARSTSVTAQLVLYIKSLGYEAKTDNFIEYYSPLTPLAVDAGIGQMGRCNMVVNQEFGNRLKLGAVLTNLTLVEDSSVDFGLVDFCLACGKCARNCPAKAISSGDPEMINGILQWPHNETKCMEMWMKTGTGICMASCPFSQDVDPDLINKMKGSKEIIQKILSMDEAKRKPDPDTLRPE
jgi:ferredoxin